MNLGFFEVGLNVANFERSVASYKSLGFELVNGGLGIQTVTLRNKSSRIALYHGYGDEAFFLQFYQGDVEAIAQHCRSRGIRLEPRDLPFEETSAGSGVYSGNGRADVGIASTTRDEGGHLLHFIWQRERPDNPSPREQLWFSGLETQPQALPEPTEFEVALPTNDLDEALEFYLKLGFRIVEDPSRSCVAVKSGDCRLSLHRSQLEQPRLTFFHGDAQSRDDRLMSDPNGHPIMFRYVDERLPT